MTYNFNQQSFSKKLKCLGVVKNPDGFKAFYSAIGNIHVYQNHNGSYGDICTNCCHNFFNNQRFRQKNCSHCYLNYIYYYCTGNPTSHISLPDMKKWLQKIAKDRGI